MLIDSCWAGYGLLLETPLTACERTEWDGQLLHLADISYCRCSSPEIWARPRPKMSGVYEKKKYIYMKIKIQDARPVFFFKRGYDTLAWPLVPPGNAHTREFGR